jgi:hypothetical protein
MLKRMAARFIGAAVILASACAVVGCASDGSITTDPNKIDPKVTFANACQYVGTADAAFKAAAPALVASGQLSRSDMAKETGIFASVTVTCTNPPANLQLAAIQLVGDGAAIYLLLSAQPPTPAFLPAEQRGMALGHAVYRLHE